MTEFIKQRLVRNLIEEIECIGATDLEIIGHNIVSLVEDKRMIHHGVNKNYKPSGYTVDSFTDDSKIITEYSTESSFFTDSAKKDEIPFFEKITNDIQHAIKHTYPKEPNKIYLITSQQEPSSFRSKFNKSEIAKEYSEKTIIYDSRELAKLIYEQSIKSVDAASFYKQFFPGFSQDLDNFEYYGKAPSFCDKHIENSDAVKLIIEHFEKYDLCTLCGVSGSGKTQLAIDYLHIEKQNFENYLWISGQDWKKDTSFSSIQRTRVGAAVNISGLFNSYKTILIIDDLKRSIDISELSELTQGFKKGSKLLITSQSSKINDPLFLPVPELSYELACKIIGEEIGEESTKSKEVITLCKSSPLILATIRNLVEGGDIKRDELYQEVLSNPNDIADNEGKSIMNRILGKLETNVLLALKKIANSGSSIHDSTFLKEFIGGVQRANLQRLSILLPAGIPGFLKIHDLVYLSVQDNFNSKEVSGAFEKYIPNSNISMSPAVMRQIHLCYDVLLDDYKSKKIGNLTWATYALLQVESNRDEIQQSLYSKTINEHMDLCSILCLIDAKEAHAYSISDQEERKKYFEECIEEFEAVVQIVENDKIKIELLHHLGKTYRRYGNQKKALDCFKELLSIDPNIQATYLQIAHLGTQKGIGKEFKDEGEKYLSKLFDCIAQDYTLVPLRVSLGGIARLRSYRNLSKKLNENLELAKELSNVITMSSFEGFEQFFEAFVSFTSLFGYRHTLVCLELIELIPELVSILPNTIDKNNWINTCEGLTNLAIAAFREGKNNLAAKINASTILFADEILKKEALSSYEGRALAKAFISAEMPKKALQAIDKVPVETHDHWLVYQKSKAELQDHNPNAYNSANEALKLAEDDNTDRISIYYDLLSQCAKEFDTLAEAIRYADLALSNCSDEKYMEELKNKLTELESQT